MHKRAQCWVVSVCMCARKGSFFLLTGKPLKCQPRPMMVSNGSTPEGWGYYIWFLVSPSSLPRKLLYKTNLDAHPRSIRGPLRGGKHAQPSGFFLTATMVWKDGYLALLWGLEVRSCLDHRVVWYACQKGVDTPTFS